MSGCAEAFRARTSTRQAACVRENGGALSLYGAVCVVGASENDDIYGYDNCDDVRARTEVPGARAGRAIFAIYGSLTAA